MIRFEESSEFQKDFKKLKKKYRTLDKDMVLFKEVFSSGNLSFDGKAATILSKTESYTVVKARLFCRSLRQDSLRIVCIIVVSKNSVLLIEIYYKGDKPREDSLRIKKYT